MYKRSKNIIYDLSNKKFVNNFKKISNSISGSFGIIKKIKNGYICARDPLGSRKIFYATNTNNKLCFSESFLELSKKLKLSKIKSVESGTISKLNKTGKVISKMRIDYDSKNKFNIRTVKDRLLEYLIEVRNKERKNTCVICLSGGLDSTIIASLAKKVFKKVITVTAYCSENKKTIHYDLTAAKNISKELKLINYKVPIKIKDLKKDLFKILESCQDWRDFNVHCAALNFYIAKFLKYKKLNTFPVITGDFMNEFFADYETESFKGKKYYFTPKINKKLKQRFFMSSLDSSAREIGVFNYFKIPLYQPYSIVYDLYLKLPKKIFNKRKSKYIINSKLIPNNLNKKVLTKKTRAQTGDSSGGIISYFDKLGLSQINIEKIFENKFNVSKTWRKNFIILGRYKT